MSITHDQNFKNLIIDYPLQALQFFAAEEAARLDPDAEIIPIRQELLKDRLSDRFFETDVPLLVQWGDGTREALLFLLEVRKVARRDFPSIDLPSTACSWPISMKPTASYRS